MIMRLLRRRRDPSSRSRPLAEVGIASLTGARRRRDRVSISVHNVGPSAEPAEGGMRASPAGSRVPEDARACRGLRRYRRLPIWER